MSSNSSVSRGRRRRSALCKAIQTICGVTLAVPAAVGSTWQRDPATPGDWFTAANWNGGVPGAQGTAEIANGGTATITSGTVSGGMLYLGGQPYGVAGAGHVVQTGGTYTNQSFSGGIYIGATQGSVASYQLGGIGRINGNSQSSAPAMYVGYLGNGTFTQTAGTNSLALSSLYIGYLTGSQGAYNLSGGNLRATTSVIRVGVEGAGTFHQTGGSVRSDTSGLSLEVGSSFQGVGVYALDAGDLSTRSTTVGQSGWGMIDQAGGTNFTSALSIGGGTARGIYRQSGGSNTASMLSVGVNGNYVYAGGTLSVGTLDNVGVFDFAGASGTLAYTGSIDLTRGSFVNTSAASLSGGANSLLIVGAGQDPAAIFGGGFTTLGTVHTRGTTLVVPAGRTVAGTVVIDDFADVAGTVTGSIALTNGINVAGPTANAQLTTLAVRDHVSGISGGQLSSRRQDVGTADQTGTFTQTGGTNVASYLAINPGSTFVFTGGMLTTTAGLANGGTLDFDNGGGTLQITGLTNLARGQVLNPASATITGGDTNSVTILPTGMAPADFGAFNVAGIVHTAGSTLNIASGKRLLGAGDIDDPVTVAGQVSGSGFVGASINLNNGAFVSGSGVVNLGPSGALRVADSTSGISGGSLSAADVHIGRIGGSDAVFSQTGGTVTVDRLVVGAIAGERGEVVQTAGNATVNEAMYLGHDQGAVGTYRFAGGSVSGAGKQYVGYSGEGAFVHTSTGTTPTTYIGYNPTGVGTYSISQGKLSDAFVGYAGTGTLVQTGGAVNEFGTLYVGYEPSGVGTVELSGGTIGGYAAIGEGGTGSVVQTGGTLGTSATTYSLILGNNVGASGTYHLVDGQVKRYSITVGRQGSGTFTQSGGSVAAGSSLEVAASTGGTGSYRLESGTLATGAARVGSAGDGEFHQLGGTHSITNELALGGFSRGTGTYRLDAGQLSAGSVTISRGTFAHRASTVTVAGALTVAATTSDGPARYELDGGSLTSGGDETVGGSTGTSVFSQKGGSNAAPYVAIMPSGRYELGGTTGGTAASLQVTQGLENNGVLDLGGGPSQVTYGGLVNLARGQVLNPGQASFTGGAGSLLIVPAGFDPATAFGSFTTQGRVHTAGGTLTIGAGENNAWRGNIAGHVDVQGSLGVLTGKTLNIDGGLTVSSGGTLTLTGSQVSVNDAISGMSGGTATAGSVRLGTAPGASGTFTQTGGNLTAAVTVGNVAGATATYALGGGTVTGSLAVGVAGAAGTVRQTGGTANVSTLTITPTGRYEWLGGTLTVSGGVSNAGVFDFANQSHTLNVSGVANFADAAPINTSAATLTGGASSLIIVPAGYDPAQQFANFFSTGLVHTSGSTLTVPAGRTVSGSAVIRDFVDVHGTLGSGISTLNGIAIRPGAVVNTGGIASYDGDSAMTGGRIQGTAFRVGRNGPAMFRQSGGDVAVTSGFNVTGASSSANGSVNYEMTGGTISFTGTSFSRTFGVGTSGPGTFSQTGGVVDLNGGDLLVGGAIPGAAAAYTLSGGTLRVAGERILANGGATTTFVQSGGTHLVAEELSVSNASFLFSGGSLAVGGALRTSETSVLQWELNEETVGAPVTSAYAYVDGTLSLTIDSAFRASLTPEGSYALLASGAMISGSFDNVLNGERLSTADGSVSFLVNYGRLSDFPANQLVLSDPQFQTAPRLYWDTDGATPGSGGSAPSGAWDGTAANFTPDAGGAGASTTAGTTAAHDVVFAAGADSTGSYAVTVTGTQAANSVEIARGNVAFTGGTIATKTIGVAAGASAVVGSSVSSGAGLTKTGAGTLTLTSANVYTGGTTVAGGTLVAAHADAIGAGQALTVSAGATVRSQPGVSTSLDVGVLTVDAAGRVDLSDGGLVKRNAGSGVAGQTATRAVTALLKAGLENGGNFDWLGNGISSTEANADNAAAGSVLFGLGVVQNNLAAAGAPDGTTTDDTPGNTIYTDFKGRTVGLNDTLVRYTYMGDADLSGHIDGTDYSLIDAGFGAALSGWINGDFDYSGSIDGTDYALIDNAFGAQAGVLPEQFQAMVARHAALFGQEYVDALAAVQSGVVPEPATALAALGTVAATARPRRRRRH